MSFFAENVRVAVLTASGMDADVLGSGKPDLTGARHLAVNLSGLTGETVGVKVSLDGGATYSDALRPTIPGTGDLAEVSTLTNGLWEFKDFIGGLLKIEKSAGAVYARGTITMSGVAVADETFVVGSQTFTWKATRTAAGEVTLGSSGATARNYIIAAINADIPTEVTAETGGEGEAILTSVVGGDAGNSVVLTTASTNMVVDGGGTLGGTTDGVDADTLAVVIRARD